VLYRDSGVDIEKGEEAVKRIKSLVERTLSSRVIKGVGPFSSLYDFGKEVIVASADGIGTKILVAIRAKRYKNLGKDIVNHCVNDILTCGARPLFFLDYFATGKLDVSVLEEIISGMSEACLENECSLVGGETAEMPGFYPEGIFDVVGFIVGVVEKDRIIDGKDIKPGDKIYGLYSSGLHTNGYSLARKVFFEKLGWDVERFIPELGKTLADALLEPHLSYYPVLKDKLDKIKGLAHITGGGFEGNIKRILPPQCDAVIDAKSWEVPPLFRLIQHHGDVPANEMYRVFNMGIGMVVISDKELPFPVIGEIEKGEGRVRIENIS